MAREVQDHYFRLAKKEGYLSRAAYKLIEIDDRRHILRKGDRVLDCGAAPGSWLQVAAERVGPQGRVVGVDLKPIAHRFDEEVVRTVEGDLKAMQPRELLCDLGAFDVILSDMAPSTSGDRNIDHHGSIRLCDGVLDRCGQLLRPGGKLVMKVLEGAAYPELLAQAKTAFEKVKGFKPRASRGESTEIYIIAEGFRGGGAAERKTEQAAAPPKPRAWNA